MTSDLSNERTSSFSSSAMDLEEAGSLRSVVVLPLRASWSTSSLPGGSAHSSDVPQEESTVKSAAVATGLEDVYVIEQPRGGTCLAVEVNYQASCKAREEKRQREEQERRELDGGPFRLWARGLVFRGGGVPGDHVASLYRQILFLRRQRSLQLLLVLDMTFHGLQLMMYRGDEREDERDVDSGVELTLLLFNLAIDVFGLYAVRKTSRSWLDLLLFFQGVLVLVTCFVYLSATLVLRIIIIIFTAQLRHMLRSQELREALVPPVPPLLILCKFCLP